MLKGLFISTCEHDDAADGVWSVKEKEDLTQMKKLMSLMLALALITGVATVTLAQDGDKSKPAKTIKKTKSNKKLPSKEGPNGKDSKKIRNKETGKDSSSGVQAK